MKKRFLSIMLTLVMVIVLCLPVTFVSAEKTTIDYKQTYIDYFNKNPEVMDGRTGFVITELNGDDIPELFAIEHNNSKDRSGIIYPQMFSIENGKVKEYLTQIDGMIMYSAYLPDVNTDAEEFVAMFTDKFDDKKALVSFYRNDYTKEDRMAYVFYDGRELTVYEGEETSADRRAFREINEPVCSVLYMDVDYRISLEEALDELFAKYEPMPQSDKKNEQFTQEKSDKSAYKNPVFNDIKTTDSYTEYILALGYLNLFKGDEKGNFNPENTITRAEFATIVCRMLGYEKETQKYKGKIVFDDVSSSHWASGYIYVASELGIINGYGNGVFGPEDPVTYEQAVKMLVCAVGNDKVHICEASGVSCPNNKIPYPYGYMAIARKYNITDSAYKVGDRAPRKLTAKLLYQVLDVPADNMNNESLITEIYGMKNCEEVLKLVNDIKKETVPENKPHSTKEKKRSTLADLINVDYASIKLKYGLPKYAMNWNGGAIYRFVEDGPWFAFSQNRALEKTSMVTSNDDCFFEPHPFATCISIMTTVDEWLELDEGERVNTLEDLEKYGPISYYQEEYSDMDGVYYHYGETSKYWVSVNKDANGNISGDSYVEIWCTWKDQQGIPTFGDGVSIVGSNESNYMEKDGIEYSTSGELLYKASPDLTGVVVIPEKVERIYPGAFKDCDKITKIVFPKGLRLIGSGAFENCTALKEANLPTGVISIEANAFKNCDNLEFVKIPESVKKMDKAFTDCDNLKMVVLLGGIDSAYGSPFDESPVENLVIDGAVYYLPMNMFPSGSRNQYDGDDNITNLYILNGVDTVGTNYGSALRAPKNIYYVGAKKDLQKHMKTGSVLSLWEEENIHEYFNEFDCPYLLQSLEWQDANAKIFLNGKLLLPDYPSKIINDVVFIDAETILSEMGLEYDRTSTKITASGNANTLEFEIGQDEAVINGKKVKLEEAVFIENGRVYIPLNTIIKKIGINVEFDEENDTIECDFPIFKEDNKEAIGVLSHKNYTFDKLYGEYIKNPEAVLNQDLGELLKFIRKPKDVLNPKAYADLLTAVLVDVLTSADAVAFMQNDILTEYNTALAKGYDDYTEKEALKKVKNRYLVGLDILCKNTDDEDLKVAISNVKTLMDDSFETTIKNAAEITVEKFVDDWGKQIISDTLVELGLKSVSSVLKYKDVAVAYLDTFFGSYTKIDCYANLILIMPIRQELRGLLINYQNEIECGVNELEDGTKVTDAYAGTASLLSAVMIYSSKQAHAIYTVEHNSSSDMLVKVFITFEWDKIYDSQYDKLYDAEMDKFKSITIIN